MKEITIYSAGTPPTFAVATSAENYWTERISYELSYMLYLLNQEGFTLTQAEDTPEVPLIENNTELLNECLSTLQDMVAKEDIIYLNDKQVYGEQKLIQPWM